MADHPLKPIFIVGNSRSGTTLVSKILNNHPNIHGFKELHFFEQLWTPVEHPSPIDPSDAIKLGARLIGHEREGRKMLRDARPYDSESKAMLAGIENSTITAVDVYKRFLQYETSRHQKTIPCEQTPRYALFINHILNHLPDARVIIMYRDPRDVLLSQKRRWRRAFTDDHAVPVKEILRTWANYHPFLISKLWNTVIREAERFRAHPHVKIVHFETLLQSPQNVVMELCAFLGIEYTSSMLDVPASRSPTEVITNPRPGISTRPIGRWKGSLNTAEIFWCQRINGCLMTRLGYPLAAEKIAVWRLLVSLISLPVKGLLSILLNIGQSKNILKSIRKRLVAI